MRVEFSMWLTKISRTTIISWSHQVEALRSQAGYRCRLAGGGRKPIMDSNMETELENWFVGYRATDSVRPISIPTLSEYCKFYMILLH